MTSLVLMLVFCLAVAIFAVQNTANVQLQFLFWKTQDFSLAILVLLSTGIGVVLTFFLSLPAHHRRYKQLKQRERELSELKDALNKH